MLADLLDQLAVTLQNLVALTGEPGIIVVALLENLFPPTPSEFLYPLAGKMAFDQQLTLPIIILGGVLGSLMGSLLYYALGYRLGEAGARALIRRYGTLRLGAWQWVIFPEAGFDAALTYFSKYGGAIVIVARIMPLVHSVVSIPAGVVRMRLLPFVLYTIIGSALWIAPLALLGYFLGSQWQTVLNLMDAYESLWYALIIAFIAYQVIRRVIARRRALRLKMAEAAE